MLARYDVKIASGSRLQQAQDFASHVLRVREGEDDIQPGDDRPRWREMSGTFDLARRLLDAERTLPDKFQRLRPWLKLFASRRGQLAQTAPTDEGDQDSDRMFELLVALCLLPLVDDLEPDRCSGDNPDLLFRYHSKTWGIACKRLHSTTPRTFRRAVKKAIGQIESSPAERGLVFVSLVNLVDHDAFLPVRVVGDETYDVGLSFEHMFELLEKEQRRLATESLALADAELGAEFVGKKAMPGVVHYVGTTYMTGSEAVPIKKTVQRAWPRGRVDDIVKAFQAGLNSTSSSKSPR